MTERIGSVLVVDDNDDILVAASLLLARHFKVVGREADPSALAGHIEKGTWDVILLDMNFSRGADSGSEGLHWLQQVLKIDPTAVVVLMTAYGSVNIAVDAIKAGATDFVLKPWRNEKLVATLVAAMRLRNSQKEVSRLRLRERELISGDSRRFEHTMIGVSNAMKEIGDIIDSAAPTDANVLISGENGTGKELISREICLRSRRNDRVFATVDLGAVPEDICESELFGHKKGTTPHAHEDRIGRIQAANGGTLFLDELSNLPAHLQSRLLNVLEQQSVVPLGGNEPIPVDVRLICASNESLLSMAADGQFNNELFYRINTVQINVPPLRDRVEDIPVLLKHFVELYSRKYDHKPKNIAPSALKLLCQYEWPGNVRELRHAVERALIMSKKNQLEHDDFMLSPVPVSHKNAVLPLTNLNLEDTQRKIIEIALQKFDGNISRAAAELGITRTSLYRRLRKYGV